MTTPARVDAAAVTDERWDDPARGTIRFRTLVSAPMTHSDGIVCGVAMLEEVGGAMIESLVPEICESEAWAAFAGA